MRMNELKPGPGARSEGRRAGRGAGSGLGKTAGRGHKGQRSRTGRRSVVGFEGGQMPLQRRLPKFGFKSRVGRFYAEVRLGDLARLATDTVDLAALQAAGIVSRRALKAKIFLSGKLEKAIVVKGIGVTKGARAAIEAAGGKVE